MLMIDINGYVARHIVDGQARFIQLLGFDIPGGRAAEQQKLADTWKNQADQINNICAELDKKMRERTAGWEGAAADSCREKWRAEKAKCAKVAEELEKNAETIKDNLATWEKVVMTIYKLIFIFFEELMFYGSLSFITGGLAHLITAARAGWLLTRIMNLCRDVKALIEGIGTFISNSRAVLAGIRFMNKPIAKPFAYATKVTSNSLKWYFQAFPSIFRYAAEGVIGGNVSNFLSGEEITWDTQRKLLIANFAGIHIGFMLGKMEETAASNLVFAAKVKSKFTGKDPHEFFNVKKYYKLDGGPKPKNSDKADDAATSSQREVRELISRRRRAEPMTRDKYIADRDAYQAAKERADEANTTRTRTLRENEDPETAEKILRQEALLKVALDKTAQADDALRRYLTAQDETVDAARNLVKAERELTAARQHENVLSIKHSEYQVGQRHGELTRAMGAQDEAGKALRNAEKFFDSSERYLAAQARIAYAENNLKKATDELTQAQKTDGKDSLAAKQAEKARDSRERMLEQANRHEAKAAKAFEKGGRVYKNDAVTQATQKLEKSRYHDDIAEQAKKDREQASRQARDHAGNAKAKASSRMDEASRAAKEADKGVKAARIEEKHAMKRARSAEARAIRAERWAILKHRHASSTDDVNNAVDGAFKTRQLAIDRAEEASKATARRAAAEEKAELRHWEKNQAKDDLWEARANVHQARSDDAAYRADPKSFTVSGIDSNTMLYKVIDWRTNAYNELLRSTFNSAFINYLMDRWIMYEDNMDKTWGEVIIDIIFGGATFGGREFLRRHVTTGDTSYISNEQRPRDGVFHDARNGVFDPRTHGPHPPLPANNPRTARWDPPAREAVWDPPPLRDWVRGWKNYMFHTTSDGVPVFPRLAQFPFVHRHTAPDLPPGHRSGAEMWMGSFNNGYEQLINKNLKESAISILGIGEDSSSGGPPPAPPPSPPQPPPQPTPQPPKPPRPPEWDGPPEPPQDQGDPEPPDPSDLEPLAPGDPEPPVLGDPDVPNDLGTLLEGDPKSVPAANQHSPVVTARSADTSGAPDEASAAERNGEIPGSESINPLHTPETRQFVARSAEPLWLSTVEEPGSFGNGDTPDERAVTGQLGQSARRDPATDDALTYSTPMPLSFFAPSAEKKPDAPSAKGEAKPADGGLSAPKSSEPTTPGSGGESPDSGSGDSGPDPTSFTRTLPDEQLRALDELREAEDDVGKWFENVTEALEGVMEGALAEHDVTWPQWQVLMPLVRAVGLSEGVLIRVLSSTMRPEVLVVAVSDLIDRGWLATREDDSDASVFVTERGHAAYRELTESIKNRVGPIVESLDESECAEYVHILNRMFGETMVRETE